MKTTHSPNQLSTNRQAEFRVWMIRNNLTYVEIGRRLGDLTGSAITGSGVQRLVQGERMPVERHRQMLELGVPVELLPVPLDVPFGRRRHHAAEQPPANV